MAMLILAYIIDHESRLIQSLFLDNDYVTLKGLDHLQGIVKVFQHKTKHLVVRFKDTELSE